MPIKEEQKVQKQHPVPQNIMDVEFKIVGDLTIHQFLYLLGGALGVYIIFSTPLSFFAKWFWILALGGASLALAFIPLEDRGLDQWLKNMLLSVYSPTQRVWRKEPTPPIYFLSDFARSIKKEIITLTPARSRRQLAEYLEGVPPSEPKSKLDLREERRLQKIDFRAPLPKSLRGVVTSWPSKPKARLSSPAAADSVTDKETSAARSLLVVKSGQDWREIRPISNVRVSRQLKHFPLEGEIVLPSRERKIAVGVLEPPVKTPPDRSDKSGLEKKTRELMATVQKIKKDLARRQKEAAPAAVEDTIGKIKPSVEELKIISPKEGRKEKAAEKEAKREEKERKTELVNQADPAKPTIPTTGTILTIRPADKEDRRGEAQSETKTPQETPPKRESLLEKAERQAAQAKASDKKAKDIAAADPKVAAPHLREALVGKKAAPSGPGQSLTNLPNVIHGTVQSNQGKLIEDAVVIVKDQDGDPIRALKTDAVGQFMISTPVPSGDYQVHIANQPETFAIIKVAADGSVLEPLKLTGQKKSANNTEAKKSKST